MRTWRVGRTPREELGLDDRHVAPDGGLRIADLLAIRRLAARLNEAAADGGQTAHAGEIVALGLLHEVAHVLIERYEERVNPRAVADALDAVDSVVGRRRVDGVLGRLAGEFGPEPDRVEAIESLLLLAVAAENPAAEPIRALADATPVARARAYPEIVRRLDQALAADDEFGPDGETIVELLRAPARHAPTSLAAQLRYVRHRWATLLPADLIDRLLAGEDLLAEEERALHLRFGGGPGGGAEGPSFAGAEVELERFSEDREWMPRIVLLAKSTYVWLDQLSRWYGREIRTLDAIPDEELDLIAGRGITGLWLIGLWQRSPASEKIKRWRGNEDAVASAYSLDDYRIADDLGGESALAALRERAARRGVRLASDMVPNHMGIDSRWVVEHPERFISVAEPPFPAYRYDGANLSDDDRVEIRLEDHYWNDSDAAVVFQRRDRATGETRYLYHGNDGTSFPWNDTAQLDFLRAEVREAVIATILDVAHRFPVIRFDAAMVLAKKHVQRLWYPLPGHGGAIPSRSEHARTKAEFDRLMPTEFWRDVVDRVAAEAPDTLLLAEAFWLLEGYFVRTLGMHRVYNSAFMHMLRDEDNAGYRRVMRDTLEFDPEILKRYVNFLTNPDEETALEQFGTGDKYFGAATLLATLPGLPMIGHGQVEGFGEKYGMEYQRARLDERPNEGLVARFESQIVALLRERWRYAEVADFLLYDVAGDYGPVEDVYAFSNGRGDARSLVVYHNRHATAGGWIHDSVAFAVKGADGSKTLVRRTLADGLRLSGDGGAWLRFRDTRAGLDYLRRVGELRDRGLFVELQAYECRVYGEFREVRDTPEEPWSRLGERLGGAGVPSLDDALSDLVLAPVHDALLARIEAAMAAAHGGVAGSGAGAGVGAGAGADANRGRRAVGGPAADGGRRDVAAWRAVEADGPAAFDSARLDRALARAGLDPDAIARVRLSFNLPLPSDLGSAAALADAWLADPEVRADLRVNAWEGADWLDAAALDRLVDWAVAIDPRPRPAATIGRRLRAAAGKAGYRVDRLVELLAAEPGGPAAANPDPKRTPGAAKPTPKRAAATPRRAEPGSGTAPKPSRRVREEPPD